MADVGGINTEAQYKNARGQQKKGTAEGVSETIDKLVENNQYLGRLAQNIKNEGNQPSIYVLK